MTLIDRSRTFFRRTFRGLWRSRDFRKLWLSLTITSFGAQITNPKLQSFFQTLAPNEKEIPAVYSSVLDAQGNPAGLGQNLQGIYAQTWHALVQQLPF